MKVTVVFAHGHELGEGHAAVPRAVRGVEEVAEDPVLAPVAETARHHRHHGTMLHSSAWGPMIVHTRQCCLRQMLHHWSGHYYKRRAALLHSLV